MTGAPVASPRSQPKPKEIVMSQKSTGPNDLKALKSDIEGSPSDGVYVASERLAEEIVDRMATGVNRPGICGGCLV